MLNCRKWYLFKLKWYYRCTVIVEYLMGIDFSRYMDNKQIDIDENIGNHYSSSAYFKEVKQLLEDLQITKNDTIIDFGSGKGAALRLFHNYPFKIIIGVELSENLYTICCNNLTKLKLSNRIHVFCDNAISYKNINDINYFYFFNPFPCHVMEKVIHNICESLKYRPRNVKIIYVNPVCHSTMIENNFSLLRKYQGKSDHTTINIYTH